MNQQPKTKYYNRRIWIPHEGCWIWRRRRKKQSKQSQKLLPWKLQQIRISSFLCVRLKASSKFWNEGLPKLEAVEDFSWDSLGLGLWKIGNGEGGNGRGIYSGEAGKWKLGIGSWKEDFGSVSLTFGSAVFEFGRRRRKTATTCATHSHHVNLLSYPLIIIFFLWIFGFYKVFLIIYLTFFLLVFLFHMNYNTTAVTHRY